jgi:hypothetical protein
MTHDNGMCTSDKKWIKTKMKTPICVNSEGNEIIAWCSFSVRSCHLVSSHHRYMCYCYQCSLHHICANWISNDNIHQSSKTISSDKKIRLSSSVGREKVRDLLFNIFSTLQNNNYNNILKCVMGSCTLTPIRTLKQMGT